MAIKYRSLLSFVVGVLAVNGCKTLLDLRRDQTFPYLCKTQVGPIVCGATNMITIVAALHKDGNRALAADGCPQGFDITVSSTSITNCCFAPDFFVAPKCPIHDIYMIIAHHYNLVYFYQNGIIYLSPMEPVGRMERCSHCENGLCPHAEIGPFDFYCQSMSDIFSELTLQGNRQLREKGHGGFFLAQLVSEGSIESGHTIRVDRGEVRGVLSKIAAAMNLKVAFDHECFYIYKCPQEIQSIERSVLLISSP